MLEEQRFDPERHDRTGFQCDEPALDAFIRKYAAQQSAKAITTVFVVVDSGQPQTILGFYTLSAAQVDVTQLSESDRKHLPRYPVPCFRMGRLARSIGTTGAGMGPLLVGLAVNRCLQARSPVGACALLVDAKNDAAAEFYRQYGFTACADAPLTLHLPLGAP